MLAQLAKPQPPERALAASQELHRVISAWARGSEPPRALPQAWLECSCHAVRTWCSGREQRWNLCSTVSYVSPLLSCVASSDSRLHSSFRAVTERERSSGITRKPMNRRQFVSSSTAAAAALATN